MFYFWRKKLIFKPNSNKVWFLITHRRWLVYTCQLWIMLQICLTNTVVTSTQFNSTATFTSSGACQHNRINQIKPTNCCLNSIALIRQTTRLGFLCICIFCFFTHFPWAILLLLVSNYDAYGWHHSTDMKKGSFPFKRKLKRRNGDLLN